MNIQLTPLKNQRFRRFARKPSEKTVRSSSRKSFESSDFTDSYIKTPTRKEELIENPSEYFQKLSFSTPYTQKKQLSSSRKLNLNVDFSQKISTFDTEIELKNQQNRMLTGEYERYKTLYEEEKQKRRNVEVEKKEGLKEIKALKKQVEKMKLSVKKQQMEKQYLTKQIEFMEQIVYDEKTRMLQSYREIYLQEEISKLKEKIKQTKTQTQHQLEEMLKQAEQNKYRVESENKVLKLENEVLLRKIDKVDEEGRNLILNSEEYTKLRHKYIHFLDEYKSLKEVLAKMIHLS